MGHGGVEQTKPVRGPCRHSVRFSVNVGQSVGRP